MTPLPLAPAGPAGPVGPLRTSGPAWSRRTGSAICAVRAVRTRLSEEPPLHIADIRLEADVAGYQRDIAGAIEGDRVAQRIGRCIAPCALKADRRTLRTRRSGRSRSSGSSIRACWTNSP